MTKRRSKRSLAQPTNARLEGAGRHKIASALSYRAARLIAEEGVVNVASALRKATRQLGVKERASLPTAFEVQAALKAQQALFQADSQPQECQSLRNSAVEVMRWLDRFSPWLVGGVLEGSASRFSQIELEVVLDDAKLLDMFLLSERVRFQSQNCRSTSSRNEKSQPDSLLYELSVDGVAIRIALFPHRAAQFSRSVNRPKRARVAEVEALLF